MTGYQQQGVMAIDPKAAEQREMQMRTANVNFAAQLVISMAQGRPEISTYTPEQIFAFALAVSEQMGLYVNRPFDEPNRLVS